MAYTSWQLNLFSTPEALTEFDFSTTEPDITVSSSDCTRTLDLYLNEICFLEATCSEPGGFVEDFDCIVGECLVGGPE